ncbi:restriction endonuclease [Natronomonas marina]|jgi:restriction system protein|uniref:restriction endonuclease n=1 Tax=Natronomonas marina TaxID=2961939 RepID=UPI0020C9BD2C|nr:restriction endonuclease [Natronomonas marina]
MVASSDYLTTLRSLSPRHFEQFVADVWQERQGWSTEVMPPGPDRGIDVLGQPPSGGAKTVVQCKRYGEDNKVSSREVQQYAALRQQRDDVEGVTIVTTGSFTSNATELAADLDIKCLDGEDLARVVEQYDAREILEWYAAGKPRDW